MPLATLWEVRLVLMRSLPRRRSSKFILTHTRADIQGRFKLCFKLRKSLKMAFLNKSR